MATAPKQNLGKMPCPDCGGAVAVHRSAPGTLSYKCQEAECESSGFAAAHTGAAKKWLAKLGQGAAAVPPVVKPAARVPAVPPVVKVPPAGAAVPPRAGFSMGGL